jgi:CheY-like chemotaxis protein
MMKVLIIDDDTPKLTALLGFMKKHFPDSTIHIARSYNSGLREAITCAPDIILLDMSMPTYDTQDGVPGGRPRPLGGLEILKEVRRRECRLKAIVVTQFYVFGDKDEKPLEELTNTLEQEFAEYFLGTVFYKSSTDEWQQLLLKYLEKL